MKKRDCDTTLNVIATSMKIRINSMEKSGSSAFPKTRTMHTTHCAGFSLITPVYAIYVTASFDIIY